MAKSPDISKIEPAVRNGMAVGQTAMSVFAQELYYLAIVDISDGKDKAVVVKNPIPLSIGPSSASGNNTSPEYYFRLPPKVHEFSEPFATNVTMTQNGGKYIESQGSPTKEIRLSGTTGLRPHKNDKNLKLFGLDTGLSGPLAQSISLAVGATPDLFGTVASVPAVFTKPSPWKEGEALGHDDIIFLRNMFRLYAWYKENAPNAASVLMVWRNIKDGDYWLVEPLEFKLSQNSSSPLTYEYSITLKTIAKFDYRAVLSDDPLQFSKDVSSFIARVNQSTAVIKQSFLAVANDIDRFARIPYNFSTFILGPMVSTIQGGVAVQQSNGRFVSLFRSSIKQLNTNLTLYLEQASSLFPVQNVLINALRKAKRATDTMLADPSLEEDSVGNNAEEKKQTVTNAYSNGAQPSTISPGSSGSKTFIGNQKLGKNIGQAVVRQNDNIRAIAGRLLGDRTQFHTLVVLNKLTAPYISAVGGPGVLKPGDTILFPLTTVSSDSSSVSNQDETPGSAVKSADAENTGLGAPQSFGRDIRLFKSQNSTSFGTKWDIGKNQNGDVATIDGPANLAQAINIKFNVARGELISHPTFGAMFKIGSKATPTNLAGARLDTEQTLLSDPRVSDLRSLNFTTVLDALYVNASIVAVGSSSSMKLSFPLRQGS